MNPYIKHNIKYTQVSHILNIYINTELCESEQNTVISTIYEKLNENNIVKNITGLDFILSWKVSNETDLLHYYTNGCGFIMSDTSVQLHTKMVMNEITQIIGNNKFSFSITKPVTKQLCIM